MGDTSNEITATCLLFFKKERKNQYFELYLYMKHRIQV